MYARVLANVDRMAGICMILTRRDERGRRCRSWGPYHSLTEHPEGNDVRFLPPLAQDWRSISR